jgi:SAM-dependent methyltransferase
LKAAASGEDFDEKKGRRKAQGVYYTPAMVTQYIVDVALGGYLRRKEEELRQRIGLDAIPEAHGRKLAKAEREFWEAYRDEVLKRTRVLDPACGSGAFLIAAFDYLLAQYESVNEALAAFEGGQRSLFDLNNTILNHNLYGVDLSKESVEITKLSLWLKTAERGRPLTILDDNIQQGDSIVDDPTYSETPFVWQERFADVFADGGFDVVIGNPPYVRQELLSPIKPYLKEHYRSFDGVADLYTYFYELGVQVLKPGGVLSYIVTNKWFKSGYGEALRRFFAEHTVFEQILDFGHAPIFEDADVFPCIVSVRKPEAPIKAAKAKPEPAAPVIVCPVPREKLADINLKQFVRQHGYEVPWSRFSEKAWSLEHPAVDDLMAKLRRVGQPLGEYLGTKPCYGIKTGLNRAFLIDSVTRGEIISSDPQSDELIKPLYRGQDVKRWYAEWANTYIVLLKSSSDHPWPWKDKPENQAEGIFVEAYPGLHKHFKANEDALRKRQDQGAYWWELRPCAYYHHFQSPKIFHTDIAWRPQFAFSDEEAYLLNTAYVWPTSDLWLLAVVNSPVMWAFMWRNAMHGKDEALRLIYSFTKTLPIAPPSEIIRIEAEERVAALIELTRANQSAQRELLDWLKQIHSIDNPGLKLQDAAFLDFDAFTAEVKKRRPKAAGKLSVSGVKDLREAYEETVPTMQRRTAEAQQHEQCLAGLINQAYGLTPEEVDLMWKTAPPRMPVGRDT